MECVTYNLLDVLTHLNCVPPFVRIPVISKSVTFEWIHFRDSSRLNRLQDYCESSRDDTCCALSVD